jgi:hypothetical protein
MMNWFKKIIASIAEAEAELQKMGFMCYYGGYCVFWLTPEMYEKNEHK